MSIITDVRAEIDPEQPNWDDTDPIISEQPATWVYWNPYGQLVLRQRNEVYEDNPYLFFSVQHLPTLIRALQQKLAEFASAEGDLPEPQIEAARLPLTNTERSRRHRQRQRNETGDEPASLFPSPG